MRIAYVCADPGIPVFGTKGCSIHVQEVIRAMRSLGHEVVLITPRPGGEPPEDLQSLHWHQLPAVRHKKGPERERLLQELNIKIWDTLDRLGPFDMVYERYSLWSHAGMTYAAREGLPGVLEINAPLIEEQHTHRELHDMEAAFKTARAVFGAASTLLPVSEGVAAYVRTLTDRHHRIEIIPNGVDIKRFHPDTPPAQNSDTFTVGFIGSLKPWHGLNDLIDAFAQFYRKAGQGRLLIVGDGPERENLIARAEQKGIRHCLHLTGAVHPGAVPAMLCSMDVAVAPYPLINGFYFSPLKIFEYMAAGRPVIASETGQIAKIIQHGKNGLLYRPGDLDAIVQNLLRLMRSASYRKSLGRQARQSMQSGHTWLSVARKIMQHAANDAIHSNKEAQRIHG